MPSMERGSPQDADGAWAPEGKKQLALSRTSGWFRDEGVRRVWE